MTKRKKIISSLLIISGLVLVSGYGVGQLLKSRTVARTLGQVTGPARCQILKKHYSKQPGSDIIYQAQPEQINILTSWEIDWFGQRIPIPKADYSEVVVTRDQQNYLVYLRGQHNKQKLDILLTQTQEPQEDFSGPLLEANLVESSSESQDLMEQIFGEPISVTKLVDLGYRHTPEALSCTYDRLDQDLAISVILVLKEVWNSNVMAAYEMEQGFITRNGQPDGESWSARWDDGAFVSEARLNLPEQHKQGELGLGIGQKDWHAAPDPPEWLTTLASALHSPTPDHWQALAAQLKQANMSTRSLETIQKIVDEHE